MINDYENYDALGLAELVEKKEVHPSELVEEAIRRIEKRNPKINAVVTRMYEIARKKAEEPLPDGPFAGVPFVIKDLVSTYAGVRYTKGCKALRDYVAKEHSELMKRYIASGIIPIGKTNTPEFGLMGVTEPELFGPTRNPWNLRCTPGGSSGGTASAIASRIVPMGSGGDGGGSIRIPSSCCGLFGLKPSRGRVPTGPDPEGWQGATTEHVLTRSVRDSAAMLDAIQGADVGAPFVIKPPERQYLLEIEKRPRKLKIGFSAKSPLQTPVHHECVTAIEKTARLLTDLGHEVEDATPDYDGFALAKSYLMTYFGEVASDIDQLEEMIGRKATPDDVEMTTWTLGLLGRAYSAADFANAMKQRNDFARSMGRFHQKYDLFLTPTIAFPPIEIGETKPTFLEQSGFKLISKLHLGQALKASGVIDQLATKNFSKFPFTQLANLTGQPAMSVPLHWTQTGLPCGVQFVAPFGDEATLFRLAAQLEEASPWFDKKPPLLD